MKWYDCFPEDTAYAVHFEIRLFVDLPHVLLDHFPALVTSLIVGGLDTWDGK